MRPDNRTWYIYALTDPRTEAIRYVGWAYDPVRRLDEHISKCYKEQNHKACWIRSLVSSGIYPELVILSENTGDWASSERGWIAFFRATGADLTNGTDGGEGAAGAVLSEETKRKISAARLGTKASEATRRTLSLSHKGLKRSVEHCRSLSAALKGRIISPQQRLQISRALTGRKQSPELIEKRISKIRGIKRSEEFCKHLRLPKSSETRAKMSAWQIGRVLPESTKQKLRLACLLRKNRKKEVPDAS